VWRAGTAAQNWGEVPAPQAKCATPLGLTLCEGLGLGAQLLRLAKHSRCVDGRRHCPPRCPQALARSAPNLQWRLNKLTKHLPTSALQRGRKKVFEA
jgi:hypothetical protein